MCQRYQRTCRGHGSMQTYVPSPAKSDVRGLLFGRSIGSLDLAARARAASDPHRDSGVRVKLYQLLAVIALALAALLQVLEQLCQVLAQLRKAGPLHSRRDV